MKMQNTLGTLRLFEGPRTQNGWGAQTEGSGPGIRDMFRSSSVQPLAGARWEGASPDDNDNADGFAGFRSHGAEPQLRWLQGSV